MLETFNNPISPWLKGRNISDILGLVMTKEKPLPGRLPALFDRDPALKAELTAYLDTLSPEKKEEDFQKFIKFIRGEMTWAEIKGYPQEALKLISKYAFAQFKRGEFQEAETLFKGLSIMDHNHWYYRAALGAIYQKQNRYEDALEEYDAALELKEDEMSSLTNRGECRLHLGDREEAFKDFDSAIKLDPDGKNPWAKRARILRSQALRQKEDK